MLNEVTYFFFQKYISTQVAQASKDNLCVIIWKQLHIFTYLKQKSMIVALLQHMALTPISFDSLLDAFVLPNLSARFSFIVLSLTTPKRSARTSMA